MVEKESGYECELENVDGRHQSLGDQISSSPHARTNRLFKSSDHQEQSKNRSTLNLLFTQFRTE